jgi:chorismate--pyruvate lyase
MNGSGWRRWLRREGSLSAHLQALGTRFEVQRLSQRVAPLLAGEARSMGLAPGTRCLVREVVLRVDRRPMVIARSVAPARALNGPWRSLQGLGTLPLAQLLFDSPQVSRSALQPMKLPLCGPWSRLLRGRWREATGRDWHGAVGWARYSVFRKAGVPLRVTEVFAAPMQALRPPQTMRRLSAGSPSTSASSMSPATTAATPSGVPV